MRRNENARDLSASGAFVGKLAVGSQTSSTGYTGDESPMSIRDCAYRPGLRMFPRARPFPAPPAFTGEAFLEFPRIMHLLSGSVANFRLQSNLASPALASDESPISYVFTN
jgi:hypothetical protein